MAEEEKGGDEWIGDMNRNRRMGQRDVGYHLDWEDRGGANADITQLSTETAKIADTRHSRNRFDERESKRNRNDVVQSEEGPWNSTNFTVETCSKSRTVAKENDSKGGTGVLHNRYVRYAVEAIVGPVDGCGSAYNCQRVREPGDLRGQQELDRDERLS
jgi:hypothetical protein